MARPAQRAVEPREEDEGRKGAGVELTGTASEQGRAARRAACRRSPRAQRYSSRISTRRFSARPSLVSFEATGPALP